MEQPAIQSASTPAPAIQAAPVVSAQPIVNAPVAADGSPMYESGGMTKSSSGSKGSFFSSLNWIEVGFGILGVTALMYSIQYYRYKIYKDKLINNEMQCNIDEIKMNVQSAMKDKYKTL